MTIEKKMSDNPDMGCHYVDTEAERLYSEIKGALCWPGAKPGYALIMATALYEDPKFSTRHTYVLIEHENSNQNDLLEWACEVGNKQMQAERFYADMAPAYWEAVSEFNRLRTERRQVNVDISDMWELKEKKFFQAMLADIRGRLSPNFKTLHISPECTLLISALQGLVPNEVTDKPDQHPALMALAMALKSLQIHDHSMPPGRGATLQKVAEMDYDPLSSQRQRPQEGNLVDTRGLQGIAKLE